MTEHEIDFSGLHPVAQAAYAALAEGYAPLPLAPGQKRPEIADWPSFRVRPDEVARRFPEGSNIGIVLGAASGGLVDVDLDTPEAVRLAPALLPRTEMTHGRDSAPLSHWWYRVDTEAASLRFKDPTDGTMLVELRSTGGQTVIPPSTHPSGEALSWHEPPAVGLPVPSRLTAARLSRQVSALAATALLVRHWPASGSRHDATLALAGGLLLAGWDVDRTVKYALLVARAVDSRVDLKDREAAVRSTAKRLEEGKTTLGWPALATHVGEAVVSSVRDWLALEYDVTDPSDQLQRVDLATLMRRGVPDVAWLIPDVLYAEKIHWVAGHPGSGKSLVTMALACEIMEAGHRVLWVDEESGTYQITQRLLSLAANPDTIEERFFYADRPALGITEEERHRLFNTVAEWKPSLVVFDSVADMLSQARLDEDSNNDVNQWLKGVIEPLKHQYHASVLCIDHITKAGEGGWARGAGAKKGKTDVLWGLKKEAPFSQAVVGTVRLVQEKDRDGRCPETVEYRIGGLRGTTIFERRAEVRGGASTDTPEDEVEARIVTWLREHAPNRGKAVSTKVLIEGAGGRHGAVRDALARLEMDSDAGVRYSSVGRSKVWWMAASTEIDFGGS